MKRGEVYIADLYPLEKHDYDKKRPVVIVSNNKACEVSPVIAVIPISTQPREHKLPTHIELRGLGIAHCENILTVDREILIHSINELTDEEMLRINKGLLVQLGLII